MRIAGKALEDFGPRIAEVVGFDLEEFIEERDGVRFLETDNSRFARALLMKQRRDARARAKARKEQEP